ncbi:MAG: RNA polymerase sigma factor [Muribaculaceae bacterium]|nr:RNA polymerase sigma factor [Muribaculaceae bacterium]
MTQAEEQKLIEIVLAGRPDRFADIIDTYQQRVHSLVAGIVADVSTADEVTQDVFIKVFQQLGKFKGESSLGSWIYRITYNTAIDAARKSRQEATRLDSLQLSQLSDTDVEALLDADSSDGSEERIALLEQAMEKISAEERALITMQYYEELSVKEMARITGLTEANVKVKLMRTRKKLYILMTGQTT